MARDDEHGPEFSADESLALTVALVARDGHSMRVRRCETAAVVREMARLGLRPSEMAARLQLKPGTIRSIAKRNNIEVRPEIDPQHWTVDKHDRTKSERGRRWRQAQRKEATR